MNKHLNFIDGLRGIAIIGVIYHHLFWHTTSPGYGSVSFMDFELYPLTMLSNGWMGVNLFFFLSGFVLYLPFAMNRRSFDNPADIAKFYKRRAKRLLPLFYFNVFVCAFLVQFSLGTEDFFSKLILVCTFTNIFTLEYYITPFNWVLWSLALEVWFSVLFPLLVLAINRFGFRIVVVSVALLSLGTRIMGLDEGLQLRGTDYLNPVRDSIIGRLDDFVVGMLCCYVCTMGSIKFIKQNNAIIFVVAGAAIGLTACAMWDSIILERTSKNMVPYINILLNLAFFTCTVALYRSRNLFKTLIENWLLMVLGMMCYSLYVWHGVLLGGMMRMNWGDYSLPVFLFSLVVIASLSYRYIEFGHIKDTRYLFRLPATPSKGD